MNGLSRYVVRCVSFLLVVFMSACNAHSVDRRSSSGSVGSSSASRVLKNPCAPASSDDEKFPVTIKHFYGSTTIKKKPKRIATVGVRNEEVPLALGIVPVGIGRTDELDNEYLLPWTQKRLEELGGVPDIYSSTVPYEDIKATQPDVILSANSGLTREQYEKLSKIAPVVSFPDDPWLTPVECMIRMNSKALGLAREGEKLIQEMYAKVNELKPKYQMLSDKKILVTVDTGTEKVIMFYTHKTEIAEFLKYFGFPLPSFVLEHSENNFGIFNVATADAVHKLSDVDIVVTFNSEGDPESFKENLKNHPLYSQLQAVRDGNIVVMDSNSITSSLMSLSPLSIRWGVDSYLDTLQNAVKNEAG